MPEQVPHQFNISAADRSALAAGRTLLETLRGIAPPRSLDLDNPLEAFLVADPEAHNKAPYIGQVDYLMDVDWYQDVHISVEHNQPAPEDYQTIEAAAQPEVARFDGMLICYRGLLLTLESFDDKGKQIENRYSIYEIGESHTELDGGVLIQHSTVERTENADFLELHESVKRKLQERVNDFRDDPNDPDDALYTYDTIGDTEVIMVPLSETTQPSIFVLDEAFAKRLTALVLGARK
jgi:hypothetical protein